MISNIKKELINVFGTRNPKKIVVFESDDWGMIRTRSKASLDRLRKKGYPVDGCSYNKLDALERTQDLSGLLDVLSKYKGANGEPAKFTLNNVVANPNFERIEESSFTTYFYELFTDTFTSYSDTQNIHSLYKNGLDEGLIQLQFHGREHVNINRWMSALYKGDQRFKDAFLERQFTVSGNGATSGRRDYLDSFGRAYEKEYESEESVLRTGLKIFEEVWGFKSASFIAPCYTWSSEIESVLKSQGVKYLQGTHVQRVPKSGLELKIDKKFHWHGKVNQSGLISIVRNVMFEPAEFSSSKEVVNRAMNEINNAFFWRKPAVISSHRVNYIGRLNEENRSNGLKLLDQLLRQIVNEHKDVIFMTTDELGYFLYN